MKLFGFEIRRTSAEIDNSINKVLLEEARVDSGLGVGEMSVQNSLSISAVYRCVSIIADTIATLPIHLYSKNESGRSQISNHPALSVVQRPNDYLKKFCIFRYVTTSVLLWGNGYLFIERDKYNRPYALYPIHPATIEPFLSEDKKRLYYKDARGKIYDSGDIVHIKGLSLDAIRGLSPIRLQSENLQLAKFAQMYGSRFFSQGGNMSGIFSSPTSYTQEAYDRLKNDLIKKSIGLQSAHIPLLLEGGLKYERISIPPEDAQFIETRKFQKDEIATIFGVPPHMIGSLDRSTNNNIEHQGREFVQFSLLTHIEQIEGELNSKLLRFDEFGKFYFKMNPKALLRGDSTQQAQLYAAMNRIGALNANQIREWEDMDPYDGGELYFVQQNMQTIENAKNTNGDSPSGSRASGEE